MESRDVAIFIFDGVELLDFCGPYEVFSAAGRQHVVRPFNAYTVAERPGPVATRNGLSVNPRFSFDDAPRSTMLVVPGGYGVRQAMLDEAVLGWIRRRAHDAELVISVCTGSLLLGRAGLLDQRAATTHHSALAELRAAAPGVLIQETERFVDSGDLIGSAGIAAGIDASLYAVARLLGPEKAEEAARHMEYDWKPEHRPRD